MQPPLAVSKATLWQANLALKVQALYFSAGHKKHQDLLQLGANSFKIYFIDHTSLSDL